MTARNFKCPPEQAAEVWQGLGWDQDTPVVHVGDELVGPANLIDAAEVFLATPAAERRKPGLIAYARDKRWRAEVGGTLAAGIPIATDDRSKLMIIGAGVAAAADPNWSTVWQGTDGAAYPVNAAAMLAIRDAVQAHTNRTFTVLAGVLSGIDAGTITTRAEVEAAFA
ncbi:hypothetical protein [Bosea massiliensis]|uniref:DUF4376 domain-containing protein n=1 Tax=Bosea massiliensis TaxID=151419 RepID=A0ABW0NXQ0_9HYPH